MNFSKNFFIYSFSVKHNNIGKEKVNRSSLHNLIFSLQISYTLIKELYEKYLCIFKISEIEDIIIKKALLHIRENIYFNAVEI